MSVFAFTSHGGGKALVPPDESGAVEPLVGWGVTGSIFGFSSAARDTVPFALTRWAKGASSPLDEDDDGDPARAGGAGVLGSVLASCPAPRFRRLLECSPTLPLLRWCSAEVLYSTAIGRR